MRGRGDAKAEDSKKRRTGQCVRLGVVPSPKPLPASGPRCAFFGDSAFVAARDSGLENTAVTDA